MSGIQHDQVSVDANAGIDGALEELVVRGVLVPRPEEVREYLLRFPDIVGVVRSAVAAACARLGTKAQLSLELYRDPEVAHEYLTLYVRQKRYDDRILDTIEEISALHEDALVSTSGWLLVTTDFSPPI